MNFLDTKITNAFQSEFLRLFLISVGVFLFILFFQPFSLDKLDYYDRLLYVTGFGAITFIFGSFVFIVLPNAFSKWFGIDEGENEPTVLLSSILLVLTATAYIFYIRFVGGSQLTLYTLFKVFLVCLMPIIILIILYKNKSLEKIIEILLVQNKAYLLKIKEYDQLEEFIVILSESKSERLKVRYKDLILIKSADNYIEVYYLEKGIVEKQLVRNTLKNIEDLLSEKLNFMRCHRTSIVNILYVEKIVKSYSGHNIKINCINELIPVSRQYISQMKGSLTLNKQ